MPVVHSSYTPPFYFRNGFLATVYSGLLRSVSLEQTRERITLKDGDFLDLDWSYAETKTNKLIILLHGLEGHGQRPYITGTAKHFNNQGFDAIAMNFRGCSGELNRNYYSYHSGWTQDLDEVIKFALSKYEYSEIVLYGISLGGNLVLKYLGERDHVPNAVKAGIAISTPCHLHGSCKALHHPKNKLFHDRFLKELLERLKHKQKHFPEYLSPEAIKNIKTLKDFDDVYTSKAHGFIDAEDYYTQCSSLQFLDAIKVPSLIINALNDSFLSPECYPVKEAKNNPNLYLEMPKYGGHVGFIDKNNVYYNEYRGLEFIKNL